MSRFYFQSTTTIVCLPTQTDQRLKIKMRVTSIAMMGTFVKQIQQRVNFK